MLLASIAGGVLIIVVVLVIIMITVLTRPGGKAAAVASSSAVPVVTYVVTGGQSEVSYGSLNDTLRGSVPMRATTPLGGDASYFIDAALINDGSVTCEILVNGAVVSKATVSGAFNVAECKIARNVKSGRWQHVPGS